jgi:hypothetical protein
VNFPLARIPVERVRHGDVPNEVSKTIASSLNPSFYFGELAIALDSLANVN